MSGETAPVFTGSQVAKAASDAVELLFDAPGISLADRDRDLLNLAANVTLTLLAAPGATLDQVITACYDRGPEEVLSWLRR
jgi:hypothetical protein